jgi:hypothetical protein
MFRQIFSNTLRKVIKSQKVDLKFSRMNSVFTFVPFSEFAFEIFKQRNRPADGGKNHRNFKEQISEIDGEG